MVVNKDLHILKLPMIFPGVEMELNLSLVVDGDELMLVDTGLPDQEELIASAIAAEGFSLDKVTRIVLTHQDMDHIGSFVALKERTEATVLALDVEVPYIEGTKPSPKMPSKEVLDANPALAEAIRNIRRTSVDRALIDGETIDFAGGVRCIATPGHTPGHMSLYLDRSKTLITGDALTSENGRLDGPMARATPDMATAMGSVKKLAALDVQTIVCYHGGVVDDDASGQLQRVSQEAVA